MDAEGYGTLTGAEVDLKITVNGNKVHFERKGNDGGLLVAAYTITNYLARRNKREFPEVLVWLMNMWAEIEAEVKT